MKTSTPTIVELARHLRLDGSAELDMYFWLKALKEQKSK